MKKKPKEFKAYCHVCDKRTKWVNVFDHKNQPIYTQCSVCECTMEEQESFKKDEE
jgi:hypothetical protein